MNSQPLPSDILLHIFHAAAANEPPRFMHVPHLKNPGVRKALGLPDETRSNRLGWVRLGHVDHQWRNTLLGAQNLWADHIGLLPAGAEEMLDRAGATALLTLHLPIGPSSSPDVQNLTRVLQGHKDTIRARLQAVFIWDPRPFRDTVPQRPPPHGNDDTDGYEIATLMASTSVLSEDQSHDLFPFNMLRSVLLRHAVRTLKVLDLSRPASPSGEFSIIAPELRHLRLENYAISCPQSTQLVTLSLVRTKRRRHWNMQPRMSLEAALDLLQQSAASLQHVELSNVFVDTQTPQLLFAVFHAPVEREPPRPRTVDLPVLRTITLRDSAEDIADLLHCLHYSQSVTTCLNPHSSPFDTDQTTLPLPISAALAKYGECHLAGLRVQEDIERRGSIDVFALPEGDTTRAHSCAWYQTRSPMIRVLVDFSPHRSDAIAVAKRVANELSVSGIDIKELALNLRSSIAQDKVLEMLTCAPNARNVCLETHSMAFSSIAYALRQYISESGSRQPYKSICLIAGADPTAITNLALMSIAFGQSRADKISLHVDERFKAMPGREKVHGYLTELEGVFQEVILRHCRI
ncbi:unnamed protein product [Peniophora sp. CBMAI 1063]|nr:unnamed protein product [Peniophora sp. CBMAI 1063]